MLRLVRLLPRFRTISPRTLSTMSKTLAVLDEAELKDGQMKEVSFGEEGKVLLAKLGDKIHATSAFCTHVGGPLAKGVLTSEGRVVCPWHGACFNVCTGDIEDSPAPNPIHTFPTHVADGKIYVTADPAQTLKENKSKAPKLEAAYTDTSKGVVIVGGGSATFHAVESLRENGYTGSITILTAEKYAPIDRTRLSKALVTDPTKLEWRSPADLKIKYGVTLRTGVNATSLSIKDKTVTFNSPSSGDEKISYDKLILATGGTPNRLPVEGGNLKNVFTFRGVQDSKDVDAAAQEGKKMVVIGSSFISMELVVAVTSRKLASIDVIGMEEVPFERVLGKQVGAGLQKFHESKGVKFHMQSKVDKLVPKEGEEGVVGGVVVNGQTTPADFVVMGVGVKPATKWLDGSGIQFERDGGVQVDQYLRLKGFENDGIFAVGDIAHFPQVNGNLARIEHWNVAGNHGRVVGKSIASGKEAAFTKVPIFWSAQGQQLRYCGLGHDYDDIIIKGDPGEMKFIAYYLKEDKVVAVACMQNDPLVSKCAELIRRGLMPSPQELRDGKNPLEVDISTVGSP